MSAYIEFFGAGWLFPVSLFVRFCFLSVSLLDLAFLSLSLLDLVFMSLSVEGLRDGTEVPSTTGIGNYLSYFLALPIAWLLERCHLVRHSIQDHPKCLITYVVGCAVAVVVSSLPRGTNLIQNIRMLTWGPVVRTLAGPLEACSSNHFLAQRKISGSAVRTHIAEPVEAPSS